MTMLALLDDAIVDKYRELAQIPLNELVPSLIQIRDFKFNNFTQLCYNASNDRFFNMSYGFDQQKVNFFSSLKNTLSSSFFEYFYSTHQAIDGSDNDLQQKYINFDSELWNIVKHKEPSFNYGIIECVDDVLKIMGETPLKGNIRAISRSEFEVDNNRTETLPELRWYENKKGDLRATILYDEVDNSFAYIIVARDVTWGDFRYIKGNMSIARDYPAQFPDFECLYIMNEIDKAELVFDCTSEELFDAIHHVNIDTLRRDRYL